jgi:cellulose synthase/poly-beta-1,6-N-acetylglucosamine synthase-like glycosyltransferase
VTALDLALVAFGSLLLVPCAVLWIEVAASLLPPRPGVPPAALARPRLAVVVPAHDEARLIAAATARIRAELAAGDRLLVVADRCRDDTAARARAAGAEVSERRAGLAGKGYALDHARDALTADPPAVVVFLDADTIPGAGTIDAIAQLAAATNRPVQAAYTVSPPASEHGRVSAFAFLVRNYVRPRGLARLGLSCTLAGTGMAIPWQVLRHIPLASGATAEDLGMSISCALVGAPPLFCAAARVVGPLVEEGRPTSLQRTRWEHGSLRAAALGVPRLLRHAVAGGGASSLALALDIAVPPLALLFLSLSLLSAMVVPLRVCGHAAAAGPVVAADVALFGLAVLAAWLRFGRAVLPPRAFLSAPRYALRKIPLYWRFVTRREATWAKRNDDG